MGFTGQRNNPEVDAAVQEVIRCAKEGNKSIRSMVRAGEDTPPVSRRRVLMVVASGAGFFLGNAKKYIGQYQGK
jgi:hypothetical protein